MKEEPVGRGRDSHLFVLGYGRGPRGQGGTSEGCLFGAWLILIQIYILNLLGNCVNEESGRLCATGTEVCGACLWLQES